MSSETGERIVNFVNWPTSVEKKNFFVYLSSARMATLCSLQYKTPAQFQWRAAVALMQSLKTDCFILMISIEYQD